MPVRSLIYSGTLTASIICLIATVWIAPTLGARTCSRQERRELPAFETFHNTQHRYAKLSQRTPPGLLITTTSTSGTPSTHDGTL